MDRPVRKSIRLPEYDYSAAGAYFLTLCVKDRRPVFWERRGELCSPGTLSDAGKTVEAELQRLDSVYEAVHLDKYCIMPDHIHMILFLDGDGGRTQFAPTISRIVKQFKGAVTKRIGCSIWQRSFYEHVIRNEQDYLETWEYIDANPLKHGCVMRLSHADNP